MEDFSGQEELRVTMQKGKPENLAALIERINQHSFAPPRNRSDFVERFMGHLYCEHLAWWADPEDVRQHLMDPSRRQQLLAEFSDALLKVGQILQEKAETWKFTMAFPCTGCTTPYENAQHSHDFRPIGTFAETWNASTNLLHGTVHRASSLLALFAALLTWRHERLVGVRDDLVDCLTQTGALNSSSHFGHSPHGPLVLLLLVGVVDNCAVPAPKLSNLAVAILSLLCSRRPAAVLSTMDPISLVDALHRHLLY